MVETYNEFHYQYNQRAKSAPNAMEKLDHFITTFAWFLDTYPIFRDLYRPGNDLMERWAGSRHSRDFFAEGIEIVRSILEQGIEEGIFVGDRDVADDAFTLYYVVLSSLSTDPDMFRKNGTPPLRMNAKLLVELLGRGLLSRE